MDKKKTITRNACAKINLGLDVVGVRGDGYHLLRMIMQQIDLFDTLTFTVTEAQGSGEIRLIDESGLSPVGEDNLICRAIRMMKEQYDLHADVEVRLIKRIPLAAGLAGGSTDAAAAFIAIRDLLVPQVTGGGQEAGLRSGTLNSPGIRGFGKAIEECEQCHAAEQLMGLKALLVKCLSGQEGIFFNGPDPLCAEMSAPHILSVRFEGVRGEVMRNALEAKGLSVGDGSNAVDQRNRNVQIYALPRYTSSLWFVLA